MIHSYTDDKGFLYKNFNEPRADQRKDDIRNGSPKDVIQNASVITILGRNELCIENYRGIIEYTDTLIRVQTRAGQIRIQGKRLRIQYYTNDEMKVSGTLSSLEFTEGRNPG